MPKFIVAVFSFLIPTLLIGCSHGSDLGTSSDPVTSSEATLPSCSSQEVADARELETMEKGMNAEYARLRNRPNDVGQVDLIERGTLFKRKLNSFRTNHGRGSCTFYDGGRLMQLRKDAFFEQFDKAERQLIAGKKICPGTFVKDLADVQASGTQHQAEYQRTKNRADLETMVAGLSDFYEKYKSEDGCVFQNADGVYLEFKRVVLENNLRIMKMELPTPEADSMPSPSSAD